MSLNAVAVQLNGTSLATIAAAPMVQSAEYNALYYPNLSQSYKIINAMGAWMRQAAGQLPAQGLRSATSTRGIDKTHPFFDPTGFSYPHGLPKVRRSR